MRYCTQADLLLMIPEATLIQLSNDDGMGTEVNWGVVGEAVRSAEEMVDAYLRGRYVLPLENAPTLIKDSTLSLARHWLYARRPEGSELPDAVRHSYKATLHILEQIKTGKLTIGSTETGQSTPAPGVYKVRAPRRYLRRSEWKQ